MTAPCQDPRHLRAPAPRCVLPHRAHDDGCERTAIADQPALLCRWHVDRLTGYVTDVRDDWLNLALILEAGSAPKDSAPRTRHTKGDSAPAPANLEALSLRDPRTSAVKLAAPMKYDGLPSDMSEPMPAVPSIVASWVLLLADERPLTATLPKGVIGQLDLLARHQGWMVQQPWVDEYVTEITELWTALRTALRDRTHRKIGYCHLPAGPDTEDRCGGSLVEENGSGVVRCGRCRESWATPREQARLAVALDREQPESAKSPVE